jgi:16S rRNA G966 N2-methylase RsmD
MTTTTTTTFPTEIKTTKYGGLISISKADYDALKAQIANDKKLHYPILINQHGDILDGHNRFSICKELGITIIEPRFEIRAFDNDLEEERFVRLINVNRRHMNAFQKTEQGIAIEHIEAQLARQRQLSGTTLGPNDHKGKTRDLVAKQVGLSSGKTYERAKFVIKACQESPEKRLEFDYDGRYRGHEGPTYGQLLEDARAGNRNLTPARAYNALKRDLDIKAKRAEAQAAAQGLGFPSNNKVLLLNKDSTITEEIPEIQDNSVDFIITDPPYPKEYLYLFDWLAGFAAKKLKRGGSVVFYYNVYFEPEIHAMFAKYKDQLSWWWRIHVDHVGGGTRRIYERRVRVEGKPMMWFVKGNRRLTGAYVVDCIQSTRADKTKHPWAQSQTEAEHLVKLLTISEDALVVDPFLGSGAFAIPAIKLGRYFIGIEKDNQVYENAVNNIKLETGLPSESGPTLGK